MARQSNGEGSGTLRDDEWLVLDGAAKLLFCALAWTLAQWAGSGRINGKFPPSGADQENASLHDPNAALHIELKRLYDLIKHNVGGRGLAGFSHSNGGDSVGIRAIVRGTFMSDLGLPTAGEALLELYDFFLGRNDLSGKPREDRVRYLFDEILIGKTFAAVCEYDQSVTDAARRPSTARDTKAEKLQNGLAAGFGKAAPLARMLAGSQRTIERITLAEYDKGASLDRFHDFELGEAGYSPIPIALLLRLSRIFGFGPTEQEVAEAGGVDAAAESLSQERQVVWNAFCGRGEAKGRGALRDSFAQTFDVAVKAGALRTYANEKLKIIVSPQAKRSAESRPATPADAAMALAPVSAARPPTPAEGVELIGLAAGRDRVTMTIEPELTDGRITLKEIGYSFDAPLNEDSDIRVCLKRITIDWNWGNEPQATLFHSTAAEWRRALCETNPGLRVTRPQKDSARLEFSVEHEDGMQFLAPLPDTALERLVLPQATHRPGAETIYTFELLASWQDVGVTEAVSPGVFKKVLDVVAGLTPAREAILALVREVKAQLEHDFPTDGTLKTLGTRVAKVRLTNSAANEAVPA